MLLYCLQTNLSLAMLAQTYGAVPMLSVSTVNAYVYLNLMEIHISIVVLNVFIALTVTKARPVSKENALIHAWEHVAKMHYAVLLIIFQCVAAMPVSVEMLSYYVILLQVIIFFF